MIFSWRWSAFLWIAGSAAILTSGISAPMTALGRTRGTVNPVQKVWYTQIGQWRLIHDSIPSVNSYLFHDAATDGAKSGEATANVRLNFEFRNIKQCEARFAIGPAPALAGLLVQNKRVTYYFLIEKGKLGDSLRICRNQSGLMTSLFVAPAKVSDTSTMTLRVTKDSLYLGDEWKSARVVLPPEFPELTIFGFECMQGTMKVFNARIEAQNDRFEESFEKATLINLHLDKLLSGHGKKPH